MSESEISNNLNDDTIDSVYDELQTAFCNYGLSFDFQYETKDCICSEEDLENEDHYCECNYDDNPYYRYQISWGGPSSEFRFYKNVVRFWNWICKLNRFSRLIEYSINRIGGCIC